MTAPHEVLGVPAGASLDEVKRAYRRLARRHHPDLNPGDPEAGDRFRRVTEAYLLVSAPGYSAAFTRAMARRPAPDPADAPRRGPGGLHLTLDVPIALAITGGQVAVVALGRRLRVDLPPLAGEGSTLRLPAAAPPEPGGGSPRDLFLRIRHVLPGALRPDGDDLLAAVTVDAGVAAGGGVAQVIGPEGRPVAVVVPRGTADGAVLRLPERGGPVPGTTGRRGDLLVRVTVRSAAGPGAPPPPDDATWRWKEAMRRFRAAGAQVPVMEPPG